MTKIFTKCFFPIAILFSLIAKGQLSDKEKFTEVLYLMDEKRFSEALPILQKLYKDDKSNANLNYNIGVALLNSSNQEKRKEALSHLEVASKNVSPNYTPYSNREDKAPVDAWYYLAKAQHSDYQFLQAIESFEKFRTYINKKHYLWNDIDKNIRMSEYAQKAIQNPVNIKSINLGAKLNSSFPDYGPVIRIDESAIYYTSRRFREDSSNANYFDQTDGMYYEDIYVSYNENGEWAEASPLNINSSGHEATINLSIDGQTLYLYKDDNGNGGLYKSALENDSAGIETWSTPEKLGSDINSKAYETHVAISPNQRTLYFISNREGGKGGKDIYYCNLLPTGNWALAQNLGDVLNTEYDEDGVFMHPDGKTLYFSSNGHQSMGGYDIMSSTLGDSSWSQPKNIGYPVNTVDDDVFFVTTPDGKRAYYSSFKKEGYGEKDIYMIQLLDAEESALTLYRGEFTFVDRVQPPKGAQVTITNNNTAELVGVYAPRQRDGQFSAILAPNNSYHFVYEADEYESYEEDIYVPSGGSYQEIYKEIKLKPVRVGKGMAGITPVILTKTDIAGGLSKNGKALTSSKIILYDEQGNILKETITDNTGEFTFTELDPSKTYLIRAFIDDNAFLKDYELNVMNDQGEKIPFEKLDDSTYIFVPSSFPYEFYGIRSKTIAGRVERANAPLVGLKVRLENEQRKLIQQSESDKYGEFKFNQLSLDNTYRIIFEGEFPNDLSILITDDMGREMRFRKVSEGVYEYIPPSEGDSKGNQMKGFANINGKPLASLLVKLEDKGGNQLQQTTTDIKGGFIFTSLNLNNAYRIVFDDNYPDDGELVLMNEFGQELVFTKVSKGVYEYMPKGISKMGSEVNGEANLNGNPITGATVTLENEKQETLQVTETDNVGGFNFSKLNLDNRYRIVFGNNFPADADLVFTNEFGDELTFMKVEDGVFEYVPRPTKYPFKSYTIDVSGNPDNADTYPRPEELKDVIVYYQKYFPYNDKDINESNGEFVAFINDIADLVKQRGYADVIITSSASKVPTKTWKSNSVLTKRRANDTKRLLVKVFTAKGLEENQFNFIDLNTLITGPEYSNDAVKNRSTYEKHQYVRIFIK